MPPQEDQSDILKAIARPGDVIAEKYRIERVIGTGGMGVVVQAFHLHFEERVAIKFLHKRMGANEEAIARFEREARAAFKIKSEHIARVIDVGKLADGMPFMVMEFLEGVDLADMLARDTRLTLRDAVSFIMQVAEAVAEAHTLGIVHRDLKPENLFLTQRSDGSTCVKVLDFGLSKVSAAMDSRKRERTLTLSTQPMGTPQYMSPEQWMSAKDVGAATDIWSLGVILHELVTGVQPFHKEQLAQLCTMVLQVEPDPMGAHVSDAPDAVQRVVDRCLMKKPEDRYPHVAALALDLYRAAPDPQLHASAKRIAGVCRRAGMIVDDDLPEASSAPSAMMVLGYAPPSGDGSGPAARPSRGQAYESDTQIMPEGEAVDEDLARTVPHPGLRSPFRDDTGPTHRQPASPDDNGRDDTGRDDTGRDDTGPTHRRAMVTAPGGPGASGQHPAVPLGDAGSSGRFAAYSADASASGNFAAQRPHDPAASSPGAMMGAPIVRAKPRADTAQSWHQILGASQRAQTGNRRVAAVVAVAGLLVALVATVAIVGGGDGAESAAPDAVHAPAVSESDPAPSETEDDEPQPEGAETSPEVAAAPSADPATSASAAATGPSPPAFRPGPRAVHPKRKPPVVRSKPRPVDIFNDR